MDSDFNSIRTRGNDDAKSKNSAKSENSIFSDRICAGLLRPGRDKCTRIREAKFDAYNHFDGVDGPRAIRCCVLHRRKASTPRARHR